MAVMFTTMTGRTLRVEGESAKEFDGKVGLVVVHAQEIGSDRILHVNSKFIVEWWDA